MGRDRKKRVTRRTRFVEICPRSEESPIGRCYTKAFGDGPRHFEPWSNDVDDTRAAPSPDYHTTPMGGRFSSRQI
ncbi:hypothetical protein TNCV_4084991 [Trichonephila clavipes]|nr:hypothetical protein TNCV_4084991 [Trichonephila clavipes]